MAKTDEEKQAEAQAKHEEKVQQDVSGFLGTDAIYQNYPDERGKPGVNEDDENEARAFEVQAQVREDAGLDPKTGKPVEVDPQEEYNRKRDGYKHDSGWSPNISSAMVTGGTGEQGQQDFVEGTDPEGDRGAGPAQVNPDGTTGQQGDQAPSAPSAPSSPQAAKKAAASPNDK